MTVTVSLAGLNVCLSPAGLEEHLLKTTDKERDTDDPIALKGLQ